MKERPILMSGPMVRAILEGRKSQTRRVVKTRHFPKLEKFLGGVLDGKWNLIPLPYGKPGDRLWVRETWFQGYATVYRADHPNSAPSGDPADKWRPSIHMPRWASRITLEIVSIRVERLQDISEADAQAEGCASTAEYGRGGLLIGGETAVERFRSLWESINGVGSWDANPFCWVIEFKVVQP